MSFSNKVSVIVLTHNEDVHLNRCIDEVSSISDDIVIVDSFSDDCTDAICNSFDNVRLYKNYWPGSHSKQLNWAFANVNFKNPWVLRLDADEYCSNELKDEIISFISLDYPGVTGAYLKRRNIFLGKELKHGCMSATKILRLWKNGYGVLDNRDMDEKITLTSGRCITFESFFYDHNLKPIDEWTKKHCEYARKEAKQFLLGVYSESELFKDRHKSKYYNLPIFLRPLLLFIYRYVLNLGFLDGKQGFVWCLLQTLWYRTVVDLFIFLEENDNDNLV